MREPSEGEIPASPVSVQSPGNFILMEAQAWTAIGLVAATLVGSLFYLGNRIDSLGARLDSRIDGLSGRIDGLSGHIDGFSGRIDDLSGRVEEQGRQLGSQIYEMAAKLDEHLQRHAS